MSDREGLNPETDAWLDRVHSRVAGGTQPARNPNTADCDDGAGPATAITQDQWTGLRTDFVGAVQTWCSRMGTVVNNFESGIRNAQADPSNISLAVTIVDGVLSEFVPTQFKVARAIVQPAFQRVVSGAGSGRVSLHDFCTRWIDAFERYSSNRQEHGRMWNEYREELQRQCGGNITFEAASQEVRYLEERLPNNQAMRRALLRSWIDSSEDESVLVGDVWDDMAGYFHVQVRLLDLDADRWEIQNAYLDDTDEQDGVIGMLRSEYPNQRLDSLPFPMRIFITHGMNNSSTAGEKGRSGSFRLRSGEQRILDAWVRSSNGHPTTSNLSRDSVF